MRSIVTRSHSAWINIITVITTDTYRCSPWAHCSSSQHGSCRMFGHPPCWRMYARCDTRRCWTRTRSRLVYNCLYHCNLVYIIVNAKNFNHSRHKPVQPVAPLLVQPARQPPHVRPPCVLTHVRALWHPPLLDAHSFTSKCTVGPNHKKQINFEMIDTNLCSPWHHC